MTDIELEVEKLTDLVLKLQERIEIQKREYELALDEGFEDAYKYVEEVKAERDALEQQLFDEFEVKLKQQKDVIINKTDQYLKYELGKMLNSFPEHADQINEWKGNNPAEVVVENAINHVEIE
jgi:hypothetical protein